MAKKKAHKVAKAKEYTHFHKDGSVWATGQIVDGQMHGYWEWFRKDGSKMRSGHFEMGKQVGKWTTFDKNGKVVRITKK